MRAMSGAGSALERTGTAVCAGPVERLMVGRVGGLCASQGKEALLPQQNC